MTHDQLRAALRELNGERDVEIAFAGVFGPSVPPVPAHLLVRNAMLIPDEPDHLVKVTDGKAIFIVDAERVVWIRIGLKN
jgi:hypothetical protein